MARGWKPPKTLAKRRIIIDYCGKKCFLHPRKLAFPICNRKCVPTCDGVRAAFSRARQHGHAKVAAKALRKACKMKCPWARKRCAR